MCLKPRSDYTAEATERQCLHIRCWLRSDWEALDVLSKLIPNLSKPVETYRSFSLRSHKIIEMIKFDIVRIKCRPNNEKSTNHIQTDSELF